MTKGMPRLALFLALMRALVHEASKQSQQFGNIRLDDVLQNVVVYSEIRVDQSIPQGDNFPPGNFLVRVPHALWNVRGGFAYQLQVARRVAS